MPAKPLRGRRVLVPRGGRWGDDTAAALRSYGAVPVVAPMINFARAADQAALEAALAELERGGFDWLVAMTAASVDVLAGRSVRIPDTTRVAAVDESTVSALTTAGYRVELAPADSSIRGVLKEWPEQARLARVLVIQPEGLDPALAEELATLGREVTLAAAYRTVGVPVPDAVRADVASGRISGIVVSSGAVARQVAEQLAPLPESTLVACIGPRTAFDARAAGLPVAAIAEEREIGSLVAALAGAVRG